MKRNICIHGHFYQPPRENPWLEEVELQDSAYPYHDWNKRITAECYAPNTASRILGPDRKIIDIVNNYSKISFNFGPTLLSWLMRHESETYKAIIEADARSRKNFSGHGSALAQCYNHMIMPLANSRDKRTQVIWGIKDFEYRFKRRPEGMWLPETAVDLESLDIMAQEGIRFTILAPGQAKRVRKIGVKEWIEVPEAKIDPKMPYVCRLPSGKEIVLFFYDGPISHDIAFGGILDDGEKFTERLLGGFSNNNDSEIVHIATDGETYGHHHRFGDMALTYTLYLLESNKLANITIYAEYLEKNPPTHEVEIFENSSWSCFHGVRRWMDDCGCNSGMHQNWKQAWRAPLRGAMDWLRDNLSNIFEGALEGLMREPWQARDDYIEIVLQRSSENIERFFSRYAVKELSLPEKIKILKVFEMQRHAMLMYTSCGWFFDDISGIETVQILQYSARALQLARQVSAIALEDTYIELLERAPSNIQEFNNGGHIYETLVKPMILDLVRAGAHYAVSSLFEEYPETTSIYSYIAAIQDYDRVVSGKQKLALGKVRMRSDITWEEQDVSFAVLHLGDHNFIGGVREYSGEENFSQMQADFKESFSKSDISQIIILIERYFHAHSYSLWHLFKDEQRKVLNQILDVTFAEVESSLRQIKEHHYSVIQVMKQINIPLPKVFAVTVQIMFDTDIKRNLEAGEIDFSQLKKLVEEVKKWSFDVDKVTLGFVASERVNTIMEKFKEFPEDIKELEDVKNILSILEPLKLNFNLWKTQNIYFSAGKKFFAGMKERALRQDEKAQSWIEYFNKLGEFLKVKVD